MRPGVTGFVHEAAFYGSDAEFLGIVVPFLRGGIEAGEPTVATVDEHHTALLRSVLAGTGDLPRVLFMPRATQYVRPASTLRAIRELVAGQTAAGAQQVRIVGEVPHAGCGWSRGGWARFEAAVNLVCAGFPLWALCPYDTRTASPEVLADVERVHPYLVAADGVHRVSAACQDVAGFLASRLITAVPLDPVPPAIELVEPTPAVARRAVRQVAGSGLPAADAEDLVFAASEAVSNARCHGVPPVRLRIWPEDARVVVAVTDRGEGPGDPYAGLLPVNGSATAGLGLWLIHQICTEVTFHRDADGFTIRMVAGRPSPPCWTPSRP